MLKITSASANGVDLLVTNLCGSRLATKLELALHAKTNAAATSGAALVDGVTRDTHGSVCGRLVKKLETESKPA